MRFFATLLGVLALAGPAAAAPNVVVFMTDDQDVESMRVMQNVQRLIGDAGATFESSFVSFPLCCPSRATFLTGRYAHNHGILKNDPGYYAFDHSEAMPVWLQRAGYATVHLGRHLNNYGRRDATEIPPGWTEWHATVDPSTYSYYNWTINNQGALTRWSTDPASYQTDQLNALAVDAVRRRAPEPNPFFMWIATMAPHYGGPREADDPPGFPTPVPAPRHKGFYADEPLPRPPSFNELDVSDKPGEVRRRRRFRASDIDAMTVNYRQRLETLKAVDEMVGDVVKALLDSGELGNTLFVFTSDNGFLQGEHRIRSGKVFLYEPSIRVPLVMRGPGIPRGVRVKQMVSNVDLAPTIAAATGMQSPRPFDGRSLFGLIQDPTLELGRTLLLSTPQYMGVRTDRYVYAEHSTGEKELYDMRTDPHQLRNVVRRPETQAIWGALAGRLARLKRCAGVRCQVAPRLKLSVRAYGRCPRKTTLVRVRGVDTHFIEQLFLRVDGELVAADTAPPFAIRLRSRRLASEGSTLRALAVLEDGRRLTLDRSARGC